VRALKLELGMSEEMKCTCGEYEHNYNAPATPHDEIYSHPFAPPQTADVQETPGRLMTAWADYDTASTRARSALALDSTLDFDTEMDAVHVARARVEEAVRLSLDELPLLNEGNLAARRAQFAKTLEEYGDSAVTRAVVDDLILCARAVERARQPQDSPTEQEARASVELAAARYGSPLMKHTASSEVDRALDAYRDAVRGEAEATIEMWSGRALREQVKRIEAEARIADLEAAAGEMVRLMDEYGEDEGGGSFRAIVTEEIDRANDRLRALLAVPDAGETRKEE
jgi:hypothetical protein